ncbi:Flp family type IVb pilin [Rhodobacteraceae bacterium RKSG542]|nr:Flp family type IVb pilin [Pseudovibrio flavus]
MLKILAEFAREERGSLAVEYGLIGGLIAISLITTASIEGSHLSQILSALTLSMGLTG